MILIIVYHLSYSFLGKSIVADEIFKQKYKQHRLERRKLLMVVWENYSLIEVQKHNLLREMKSKHSECSDEFNVLIGTPHNLNNGNDIILLDFLTQVMEDDEIVDIIIDELPSDAVHEIEIEPLKKLLDEYPQSSITIIPQSVIIDRQKDDVGGKIKNIGRNCLTKIGLQEFTLSRTMRNTNEIFYVLRFLQHQKIDSTLTMHEKKSDQATTYRVQNNSFIEKMRTVWRSMTGRKHTISSLPSAEESSAEFPITGSKNNENEHPDPYFDKIAKHLHESDSKDSEKSVKVVSTYSFYKTEIGNQVKDDTPILVNLSTDFNMGSMTSAKRLAITLKEVCQLSPQTLIICNILEEVRMLYVSLSLLPDCLYKIYIPHLQGRYPTLEEKRLMSKYSDEGRIIVLDNTAAKGLESKNVIIFVQDYEHFLRHEFVETLARANVRCHVIVYKNSDAPRRKENTIAGMFSMLIEKELVDQVEVSSEENHKDFKPSRWSNENENHLIINDAFLEDGMNTVSFDSIVRRFDETYPERSREPNYR